MPEDKPGTCIGDEARLVSLNSSTTRFILAHRIRPGTSQHELSYLGSLFASTAASLPTWSQIFVKEFPRTSAKAWQLNTSNPEIPEGTKESLSGSIRWSTLDFQDQSPDPETMEPHELFDSLGRFGLCTGYRGIRIHCPYGSFNAVVDQ